MAADQEKMDRFITLRANGWSYSKISQELQLSKPTLIAWSRKFQYEIQNLKAIQADTLREKWLASTAERVNALGEELRKIQAEIAKRDLSTVSTARLYTMADALRREIDRQTSDTTFTCPVNEIPKEEYHEEVQDWRA